MIFDIIVLAVLLVSALHAFWRGFIREVLTIFGAIGGVFAALAFGDHLRPIMDGWLGVTHGHGDKVAKLFDVIPMSIVSTVLSYAAIFIVVFGVLSVISYLISEQVRSLGLGAVDRTLGVVFGLVRGFVILGIFYLPIHLFMDDSNKKTWFQESKTQVVIASVSEIIKNIMPGSLFSGATHAQKPEAAGATLPAALQGVLGDIQHATTPGATPAPAPAGTVVDKGTAAPASTPPDKSGYSPAARNKIDQLIEKSP